MALIRKTSTLSVVFAFGGALLGGVLAESLKHFSTEGMLRNVFLKGYGIGLDPPFALDMHLFSLTLGFMVEVNLFVLLGALTGFFIFKQI